MDSSYAVNYEQLYRNHWWWRARERAVLSAMIENGLAWTEQSILDVGCGNGLLFEQLETFGSVAGVEIDAGVVPPDSRWRGQIHVGPFDETFQPGRQYSVILMLDVLEHLPGPAAALRHATELLADNGCIIITLPAFRALWTTHDDLNHHFTRYTKRSFRELVGQTDARITSLRYFFHWAFPAKLAVRLKEAVLPTHPAPPRLPPRPVNAAFYGLSRLEQLTLGKVPVPFGSSLLAVVRK